MLNRRRFLHSSFFTSVSLLINRQLLANEQTYVIKNQPIVLSTWGDNVMANAEAWKILSAGGRSLDAVEKGVQIPETDPNDKSVGYGGLPDRDGHVTLDACIMDERGNCGAVMALEHIMHPISVARLVMEKTPHVQLAGEGALQFALANGFQKQNLLTPESEKAWKEWLKSSKYDPITDEANGIKKGQLQNHDTIGMVAMDVNGNISGACTTSGLAFKMHGRVGDSPIIGAGLFVDNEVGAATSTGMGEEVVKICGSHTVVELMRQGISPELACKKAVERIIKKQGVLRAKNVQVGFLALNKKGQFGGYALQKGFTYAVRSSSGVKVVNSKSMFK
ncbi:MAG: N(4)-(beta-N-acetylglucosaminyl)-L-asparaginase [Chitinophagaceae bacterium]|nr:N(4)-(beta-N-acetylglucosaminyl)-L-asparaginase [Chitinophagaceae bacterium]